MKAIKLYTLLLTLILFTTLTACTKGPTTENTASSEPSQQSVGGSTHETTDNTSSSTPSDTDEGTETKTTEPPTSSPLIPPVDTDEGTESETTENLPPENPKPAPLIPPSDLIVENRESTSFLLSWEQVSEDFGYNLYLDGKKVNSEPITETSYLLTGLSPSTIYELTISSVNSAGEESAQGEAHSFRTTK